MLRGSSCLQLWRGHPKAGRVRNVPLQLPKYSNTFLISARSLSVLTMAPTLGKRKRRSTESIRDTGAASQEPWDSQNKNVQDVFRRHFEASFRPLSRVKKSTKLVEEATEGEDEYASEWEGISGSEGILQDQCRRPKLTFKEGGQIEIIEHAEITAASTMTKDELKEFMVGIFSQLFL